jgi:hypothetical protein
MLKVGLEYGLDSGSLNASRRRGDAQSDETGGERKKIKG